MLGDPLGLAEGEADNDPAIDPYTQKIISQPVDDQVPVAP